MYANLSAGGKLRGFEFVYNRAKCCFGTKPLVQERVFVRCPRGKSVRYIDPFARLTGMLHVKLIRDRETGVVRAVYELDLEHIEPV